MLFTGKSTFEIGNKISIIIIILIIIILIIIIIIIIIIKSCGVNKVTNQSLFRQSNP